MLSHDSFYKWGGGRYRRKKITNLLSYLAKLSFFLVPQILDSSCLFSLIPGTCPDSWAAVGNKCVHVSTDPMTWWEAHDYCATLSTNQGNGMLASMPDCLDFAELTYYMGFACKDIICCFIDSNIFGLLYMESFINPKFYPHLM